MLLGHSLLQEKYSSSLSEENRNIERKNIADWGQEEAVELPHFQLIQLLAEVRVTELRFISQSNSFYFSASSTYTCCTLKYKAHPNFYVKFALCNLDPNSPQSAAGENLASVQTKNTCLSYLLCWKGTKNLSLQRPRICKDLLRSALLRLFCERIFENTYPVAWKSLKCIKHSMESNSKNKPSVSGHSCVILHRQLTIPDMHLQQGGKDGSPKRENENSLQPWNTG